MNNQLPLFFSFLHRALAQDERSSLDLEKINWNLFFHFSQEQAIVSVVFEKIQNDKIRIDKELLFNWFAQYELIKRRNILMNHRALEVTKVFADAGFRSCILKGQGNNLLYPNPYVRNSGDIDIWIDAPRKEITAFVKSKCPEAEDGERHIHFPYFKDVEVEVHYYPCSINVPKYNRQLQSFFHYHLEEQFSHQVSLPGTDGMVCVPTLEFNVIHQLSHIMSHFFIEGIGLRQFVDYYYVLKHFDKKTDVSSTLKETGMLKFARGVMWVEHDCLGLDEQYLITEPDEKIGRLILKEILEGGNFGRHDQRYTFRKQGYWARGATDVFRLLRLTPVFPSVSLWTIVGKVKNQKWKVM